MHQTGATFPTQAVWALPCLGERLCLDLFVAVRWALGFSSLMRPGERKASQEPIQDMRKPTEQCTGIRVLERGFLVCVIKQQCCFRRKSGQSCLPGGVGARWGHRDGPKQKMAIADSLFPEQRAKQPGQGGDV